MALSLCFSSTMHGPSHFASSFGWPSDFCFVTSHGDQSINACVFSGFHGPWRFCPKSRLVSLVGARAASFSSSSLGQTVTSSGTVVSFDQVHGRSGVLTPLQDSVP